MPRRPRPLDPNDGPAARFALQLRVLRDRRGAHAPSVQAIAHQSGVSRSAMFAALNGRLPSRHTLEAMVLAWGGDPQEWFAKRRTCERDLELARLGRPPTDPGPAPTTPSPQDPTLQLSGLPPHLDVPQLSQALLDWDTARVRRHRRGRPLITRAEDFPSNDSRPPRVRQFVAELNKLIMVAGLTYNEIVAQSGPPKLTIRQVARQMSEVRNGPSREVTDAIFAAAAERLGVDESALRTRYLALLT